MEFDPETYWDTAGAIDNNEKVFMSLKLGDEIIIDPEGANDKILQHVLLTTGHTGNMSVWAKNVGTRVVCANTYAMAMGEEGICRETPWLTSGTVMASEVLTR